MPRAEAPLIDPRTYGDLVADVEALIVDYTDRRWQPDAEQPDAGQALVRIFSRMAELVVTRINRLPDHNFLAFLDLIGTRLHPPQPARVPLTFLLAAGSPVDALVPAGTQAAAVALEGEANPPVFATERDLIVTRSQLVAVCSRDPRLDRWDDHTETATGQTPGTFHPFLGSRPMARRLYVSHPQLGLPDTKTVELSIERAGNPWPFVAWSFWDGTAWTAISPEASFRNLRFSGAAGAAASLVNGIEGHWLRGELAARDGDWVQPSLGPLKIRIVIESRPTVPQPSFANQAPLDLSKDALPFGDKPKIGDTFYLAADEALSKPGATAELHIEMTDLPKPGSTSPTAMLTWESWDGREWLLLGNTGLGATTTDPQNNSARLRDTTNAFLKSGTVSFTVPCGLAPSEVNGEVRHWLRVRIARGNYGVEASYKAVKSASGQTFYELDPGTLQPPSLRSAKLGYRYDSGDQAPCRVLTENDFRFADVTKASSFSPFLRPQGSRPTLHLGFERPGDAIGFANRTTTLFFEVAENPYAPSAEQQKTVLEQAAVVWEYWDGAWQQLGALDETRGLTRRGLLTFIGPPDFKASEDFGRTAFWLRGRWERGDYAVEPRLARVSTNTMWALHAETIEGEVLGSSLGVPEQVYRTLRAPVLDGQVLEVIEPEIPSGADLAELEAEEGDGALTVLRDAGEELVEVRVRWHEVPDFHGSGPRSRHYSLERITGEIRFGDGRRGLIPPAGRDNIRMARYRTGGGLNGNRPAGSIARLQSTVPYVTGVVQPVPSEGGAAQESLEAVRLRGPKALRHRDRSVAAADFEDLAFEASTQVARAYVLPARDVTEEGKVGLIVVPDLDVAQPIPSLELLARVRSYLEARLSPVVDVSVTGPDWLRVSVKAEVFPQKIEAAIDVQNAVLGRLRAFLHPLSGGPRGDGWALGRLPHRSDLYALIEETPGVDHVLWLEVEVKEEAPGTVRSERAQIFSGLHEITVQGSANGVAASPGSRA